MKNERIEEKIEWLQDIKDCYIFVFGLLCIMPIISLILGYDMDTASLLIVIAVVITGYCIISGINIAIKAIRLLIKYWAHTLLLYFTYYMDEKDPDILHPEPDILKVFSHLDTVTKLQKSVGHMSFEEYLQKKEIKEKIEKSKIQNEMK